jgi:uncharacterized protein (TIGR00290 family)
MALHEIQQSQTHRAAALLTTFSRADERIQIHNVRRELIEAQATSIGLPLRKVLIAKNATNMEYECAMAKALSEFRDGRDVLEIVFGDLFLEEIRDYREQFLARQEMRGLYPVWKRETTQFVKDFIKRGFKAVVVSVRAQALDKSFAGQVLDEEFLQRLPYGIDPCGENGEFHSFVFDGPIFKRPIEFRRGEVVLRDDHYCCDLLQD